MGVECGKDSAGDSARKGFRAERARVRPGKDSGPSERECGPERIPGRAGRWVRLVGESSWGVGSWLRPEGAGLQVSKSGQGSFQQSAISSQSSARQGGEHEGCSGKGGWSGAAAGLWALGCKLAALGGAGGVGPVTEAAALLAADPVVANASRKQTASAVFPEGQTGRPFYDWFTVGQFLPHGVTPSSLF